MKPSVTVLKPGSKVTFGKGNIIISEASDESPTAPAPSGPKIEPVLSFPAKYFRNGAVLGKDSKRTTDAEYSSLDAFCDTVDHFWNQSRHAVQIGFLIPKGMRARNVTSVKIDERQLSVAASFGEFKMALNCTLAYPIECEEDDMYDLYNLEDFGSAKYRCLLVNLRKKHLYGLNESAVFWWDRVFEKDEKIDVSKDVVDASRRTDVAKAKKDMQECWAKAQQQFQEKVRDRQPIIIDKDEED